MEQLVDAQLADRGTQLALISAFSILALVLASVGLYRVLAYAVTQQTPEIGLRMRSARRAPAWSARWFAGRSS